MLLRVFCITLITLHPFYSAAQAQANFREICRSSLGGKLLEQETQQKQDANTLQHLAGALQRLNGVHLKLTRDRNETDEAVRKDALNMQARDLLQLKKEQISRLEAEVAQLKELQAKTQQNHDRLKGSITSFKKALSPIFTIATTQEDTVTADVLLNYRDPCPKFLAVCPLPEKSAKLLAKVLPEAELPVACKKYAQQKIPEKL